jgi:hypothetical protein
MSTVLSHASRLMHSSTITDVEKNPMHFLLTTYIYIYINLDKLNVFFFFAKCGHNFNLI